MSTCHRPDVPPCILRVRPARLDFLPECLRDEQVDLLVSPLGRRQALQEHEQRVEVWSQFLKISIRGRLILSKRKGLWEVMFS